MIFDRNRSNLPEQILNSEKSASKGSINQLPEKHTIITRREPDSIVTK